MEQIKILMSVTAIYLYRGVIYTLFPFVSRRSVSGKRHVASGGKTRTKFPFAKVRHEQISLLRRRADKILSCWDESWELYRTRKTHQFPGISDRSILQRQQHHCAQSHWRWRMKTPFNNIAYSSASALVQTFFTRGEMIDCARAHGVPQSKLHPRCRSICRSPLVNFTYRVDCPCTWKQQRGVKVRDATSSL